MVKNLRALHRLKYLPRRYFGTAYLSHFFKQANTYSFDLALGDLTVFKSPLITNHIYINQFNLKNLTS